MLVRVPPEAGQEAGPEIRSVCQWIYLLNNVRPNKSPALGMCRINKSVGFRFALPNLPSFAIFIVTHYNRDCHASLAMTGLWFRGSHQTGHVATCPYTRCVVKPYPGRGGPLSRVFPHHALAHVRTSGDACVAPTPYHGPGSSSGRVLSRVKRRTPFGPATMTSEAKPMNRPWAAMPARPSRAWARA